MTIQQIYNFYWNKTPHNTDLVDLDSNEDDTKYTQCILFQSAIGYYLQNKLIKYDKQQACCYSSNS